MSAMSISATARKAKVTRQAVSIALDEGRLTPTLVTPDRRAVKVDAKYETFLKSTRNRINGTKKKAKHK